MKKTSLLIVLIISKLFLSAQISKEDNYCIYPSFSGEIIQDKNIIYCSSFNTAWNKLNEYLGLDKLMIKDPPLFVHSLNNMKENPVTDGLYYWVSDKCNNLGDSALIDSLRKRLGFVKPSHLKSSKKQPINIWVYLNKNVQFQAIMRPIAGTKDGLKFRETPVAAFSNLSFLKTDKYKSGLQIYDFKNENDFILKIDSKDSLNEVFLAKIQNPKKTIDETYFDVIKRVKSGKKFYFEKGMEVRIPYLSFSLSESFTQLKNKVILNSKPKGKMISEAIQQIDFNMDHKSISIKSIANIEVDEWASNPNKLFLFDKPFMIIVKEKNAKLPYFVVWISNTSFMNCQ